MLKDVNPGAADSNAHFFTYMDGVLFFQADDGNNGIELWRSDGTTEGTTLVKDINPGSGDSDPNNLYEFSESIYFVADNGTVGYELWKTDGTSGGTVLVKDINPDSPSSSPQYLIESNGVLFFRADDGSSGIELWKTDGTTDGTTLPGTRPGAFRVSPHFVIKLSISRPVATATATSRNQSRSCSRLNRATRSTRFQAIGGHALHVGLGAKRQVGNPLVAGLLCFGGSGLARFPELRNQSLGPRDFRRRHGRVGLPPFGEGRQVLWHRSGPWRGL